MNRTTLSLETGAARILCPPCCAFIASNNGDPAAEDALYEITAMRQFAGLSLEAPIPNESTVINFRHLLERHELGEQIFEQLNAWLSGHGVLLKQGTVVDTTIIEAPTSTKNKIGKRDPEMHQTKKGYEWHFGMKVHIGVDPSSGLTRSMPTTTANTYDLNAVEHLLCGEEELVLGDAGY